MTETTANLIVVPWFSRADYPSVRLLLAFGERLPATFDEWQAGAEATCVRIETQRGMIERVDVDSGEFAKWCRENRRPTNERSLSDFLHTVARSRLANVGHPRPDPGRRRAN